MSDAKFIVLLDDGRFVARGDGRRRYYAREYPNAYKFSQATARKEVTHLVALGVACRAISETEYAQT